MVGFLVLWGKILNSTLLLYGHIEHSNVTLLFIFHSDGAH